MSTRLTGSALARVAFLCIFLSWAARAEHAYLDDSNKREPSSNPSLPALTHEFPRVLSHEIKPSVSDEDYSKYQFIDIHGTYFPNVERIQSQYSSDTMVLRHISGRAYQSYNFDTCSISSGPAFESTTGSSQGGPSSKGCGIYAGHWLYKAGTTLLQNAGSTATTLSVADPSRIQPGYYVVIYDAPAGSFKNAEHARVVSVNSSNKTITVERGYKSKKVAHSTGSIVAQHALGQGTNKKLWAFNLSTQSPRDGSGKTFAEFYADWLGDNLLKFKDGRTTTANVAGVMFDADFYFEYKSANTDTNNDLVTDNGVSPNGTNWLGDGLDEFYQRVRQRLAGYYVLVGVHDARGYPSAHGGQMESWLDYGNGDFNPVPKYSKLDKLFVSYLFNMAERGEGPALVHNLTKTPTKLYPGESATAPASNAAFRLGLTMTLMEDGYFGTHTAHEPDAWWDEYAVDVDAGSANYGKAIAKNNTAQVRNHRGWLGKPLGAFTRIYDDTTFAANKSLVQNATFDSNLANWRSVNASISRVTSGQQDGAGAMRVSGMQSYSSNEDGASVKSDRFPVTAKTAYTLAFSARSSTNREIRITLGDDSYALPVSDKWRRYVVTLYPTKSVETALKFGVGREDSTVWLDSVYLFRGDANIFQREFENGLVLANATRNSKTISIGPGYRRIDGIQDRSVNNGNSVDSVTIGPYDGIVLVREADAPPPPPPPSAGGAQIGDWVWRDTNGNGLQDADETGWAGATVHLRECNGAIIATTATDAQGNFVFGGLGVGSYQLEFVNPGNAKYSPYKAGGGGPNNSDASETTGLSWCVKIKSDTQKSFGVDAGFVPDGTGTGGSGNASIGDYVWSDVNGNGVQDSGEPGVNGVAVRLRDCGGLLLESRTTAADGSYLFDNLAAGSYMIQWVLPTGASFTVRRAGSSGALDSNADSGGFSHCVKLSETGKSRWIDAGLILN